jgi:hypothetical protein
MFARSSNQSVADRDKGIPVFGRGAVSGRIWEENLDDAVSETSENIDKFNDLKSRSTVNSPLRLNTSRPTSSSKMSLNSSTHKESSEAEATVSLERKIDYLFRRSKLMDEKMRAAENEKLEIRQFSQETIGYTWKCIRIFIYVYLYVHIYIYIYYICVYVFMYVYIYVLIYMSIKTYLYVRIYTHK